MPASPTGERQWGGDIEALTDERKTKGGTKTPRARTPAGDNAERDVGHSLRSVYSSTVNEDIPAELLDLLGKLS